MPLLENLLGSPSPSFKYISITQLEVRMIELTHIQNCRYKLSRVTPPLGDSTTVSSYDLLSCLAHRTIFDNCLFVTKKQLKFGLFGIKNFCFTLF